MFFGEWNGRKRVGSDGKWKARVWTKISFILFGKLSKDRMELHYP